MQSGPHRFCHLSELPVFDTTSPGLGGHTEPRLAPRSGNLTPPRFSPSCPHCLSLWLGRGTIVGGQGHCETACQCCFEMSGSRSPSYGPSFMQYSAQMGLGALSASLFLSRGLSAEVIQSPDMTAWVRCFSKNKRRTIFPLTFYWELFSLLSKRNFRFFRISFARYLIVP